MRLTIDSKDARIVRMGLQNLEKEIPDVGRKQIYDTTRAIVKRMKVYPPPPQGSTYIRTYRLKRSWNIRRLGASGYRIENDARYKGKRYTRYVVGDAYGTGQAWMHVGRWLVFRDVVDEEFEKLPEEVESHLHMVVRRSPGWRGATA